MLRLLLLGILSFSVCCEDSLACPSKNSPQVVQNQYEQLDVLIEMKDGEKISAIVMKKKGEKNPLPVVFQFTIYVRDKERDIDVLKHAVDKGYVGVIAYTRGKRHSKAEILPYENDGSDGYEVLDWISKQTWCNRSIGMYGGSYNGFTQWAICKKMHPCLKTIVPYVANCPGNGLPMENNIFINPNYEWSFLVGSNRYMNHKVANDRRRFRIMQNRWWEKGLPYNELDKIDGTPNRLFQRWIKHPSYDAYWQAMVPYKKEFALIDIPVLSIDGYFNDSQNSGLYYLKEHCRYNSNANHYLIIGPYSHFGAQRKGESVVNGYSVDPDSLIDTNRITFQWFDYVLRNGPKPAILKDKINYQAMGTNTWKKAPNLDEMNSSKLKFFLSFQKNNHVRTLAKKKSTTHSSVTQKVDFSDRTSTNNSSYYPDPLVLRNLDLDEGLHFLSDPIEKDILISGSFSGKIFASINKRDFDFGVTLYQVLPDGSFFNLSYFVGRASFAKDSTNRQLLVPGKKEELPFSNTRLICKKIQKGSRFLVKIDVNKNSFSQINYGTGKDVSSESIADASDPLNVKWYNDSCIVIPIDSLHR